MKIKSFWSQAVEKRSLHDVRSSHLSDRTMDAKMKWLGYKNIPSSGVVSNIFRVLVDPKVNLYCYNISFIRQAYTQIKRKRCLTTTPCENPRLLQSQEWAQESYDHRTVQNHLNNAGFKAPCIFMKERLYTTHLIPSDQLLVSPSLLDLHTKKCTLNLSQKKVAMLDFPVTDLQRFSNQMIKWCVKLHEKYEGNYYLARESNGKIVDVQQGFVTNGLRIFHGIQAQMVYINNQGENDIQLLTVLPPPPHSRTLEALSVTDSIESVCFQLQVTHKVPQTKSGLCTNFLARDDSGTVLITSFNHDSTSSETPSFDIGSTYEIKGLRLKLQNPKFKKGDFEFYLLWGSRSEAKKQPMMMSSSNDHDMMSNLTPLVPSDCSTRNLLLSGSEAKKPPRYELGLRLDTLATVASDTNLLTELIDEFGEPPYSKHQCTKILSLFHSLPVVDSLSLAQSHIVDLRFPQLGGDTKSFDHLYERENECPVLPQRYKKHLHELSFPAQPVAILRDITAVPVQFLHRAYDMKNNWQYTTVPACSILPSRRLAMLQKFCRALAEGLEKWGMKVLPTPMITKNTEIMQLPKKRKTPSSTEDPRVSPPKRIIIILIQANKEDGGDAKQEKAKNLVNALCRDVHATEALILSTQSEAVQTIKSWDIQKICSALIFISEDWKKSSFTMTLFSVSTQKGYIPLFCRPCRMKAGFAMWKSHTIRHMHYKINGNPLSNVDLSAEVPSLQNRLVFIIGIDTCHTYEGSTGAVFGTLYHGPIKIPVVYPYFWSRSGARVPASEVEGVSDAVTKIVNDVVQLVARFKKQLHEIIIMQDGSIYSNVEAIEKSIPKNVEFTYMNLHKRTNMRFISSSDGLDVNCPKGCLVNDLTPTSQKHLLKVHKNEECPEHVNKEHISFFLQSHECKMSTARSLQFVCQRIAPSWDVSELKKLCFALSFAHSLLPSKLPFPAKCAHILAEKAHKAWLEDPDYSLENIPTAIRHRMWFL